MTISAKTGTGGASLGEGDRRLGLCPPLPALSAILKTASARTTQESCIGKLSLELDFVLQENHSVCATFGGTCYGILSLLLACVSTPLYTFSVKIAIKCSRNQQNSRKLVVCANCKVVIILLGINCWINFCSAGMSGWVREVRKGANR
jgi:hypothetical protein